MKDFDKIWLFKNSGSFIVGFGRVQLQGSFMKNGRTGKHGSYLNKLLIIELST